MWGYWEMRIEKYGIAENCGYGPRYYQFTRPYYSPNLRVIAKSQLTTDSIVDISGFPNEISGIYINKDGTQSLQPLYVVYEGESQSWKEYFSGLELCIAENIPSVYDVDKVLDSHTILCCKSLSVPEIRECSSTELKNGISGLSESQINDFVEQLYTMQEQAKKWGIAFDKAVQTVKEERKKKESEKSGIESTLDSGFGRYRSGADMGSSSYEFPSDAEVQNWKDQGRCSYCGGAFKGIFTKSCRVCGKAKAY